jgi:ABC-type multidrug transport system permease subunit
VSHPLWQLFLARVRGFYREPVALFWVYGFPLIMAVGLGVAFMNRKQEPAHVDVADSPGAADLCKHLGEANLVAEVHSPADCRERLRTGKSVLFVEATEGGFRYVYDPAHPNSLPVRTETDAAILRWKADVDARRLDAPGGGFTTEYTDQQGGTARRWHTADELVSEPGNRYIDWFIPGLMGMNLMGGGLFGIGFSLVDMRVRKLLKRLLATPMRRSHLMWSLFGGRVLFLVPEMGALLLLAIFGFHVPVRGNPLILGTVILVGAFAFSGIGLLLASRTEKMETISGLVNLVALPSWLLSGVFFSARRFPDAAQPVIQALPLTQLNDALREVMLEGASLTHVAWRLAILAAWGGAGFLLAARWFRWQ